MLRRIWNFEVSINHSNRHKGVCRHTNIFVTYYVTQGNLLKSCSDFFKRTAVNDVYGYTSVLVAAETIHRVLVAEAAKQLHLASRDTIAYLQKHPDVVKQLKQNLTIASDMRQMGINILHLTHNDLHRSKAVRSAFGLLTNDSLIVATMEKNNLVDIATNDAGFLGVVGLRVWRPNATQ